jgi:MFS family permease
MVSVTIAAGALMQIPIGRISDLVDRRFVLAGVAALAAFVGLIAFLVGPSSGPVIIVMTGCYGALAYALYPVAVAHANDHATAESFVKVSSGLLLLYGFGTMLGPLLAAAAMDIFWPSGLFAITMLAHISITGYALFRSRQRAAVPKEEKDQFKSMPSERGATPEAMNLDPRAEAES